MALAGTLGLTLFEKLDARFALDAAAVHRVPEVASAEERPGGFHGVEMMNDEDVVRIIEVLSIAAPLPQAAGLSTMEIWEGRTGSMVLPLPCAC